jgi:hypothetical protein
MPSSAAMLAASRVPRRSATLLGASSSRLALKSD